AAQLDPEVRDAELPAVAVGPEEVRAALEHRDHVLVADVGRDPLLLAPDARAVGPERLLVAVVEELDPGRGRAVAQGVEIVRDLEQVAAARAAVEDFVERVAAVAAGDAAEGRGVRHARSLPVGDGVDSQSRIAPSSPPI